MLSTHLKRSIPTLAVVAGLLVASTPAGADAGRIVTDNKDPEKALGTSLTAPLGSTKGSVVQATYSLPEVDDEVLITNGTGDDEMTVSRSWSIDIDLAQPDMQANRPTSPPTQGSYGPTGNHP
jgi:hypothetical protein